MSVLPASDRSYIGRLMSYFGISRLKISRNDNPRSDIAVSLGGPEPEIHLGEKWRRNRRENPELAHIQLAHEGLHIAGVPHSRQMRANGFWSRNRQKDTLSRAVYEDIASGTKHFTPRRFGLGR